MLEVRKTCWAPNIVWLASNGEDPPPLFFSEPPNKVYAPCPVYIIVHSQSLPEANAGEVSEPRATQQ